VARLATRGRRTRLRDLQRLAELIVGCQPLQVLGTKSSGIMTPIIARKAQYRFQVLRRDAAGQLSSATGSFVTK
jgi:hypothetical protein